MVSQTSINDTLFGLPVASNPHDNGRKQEKLLLAVKVMKNIEQILVKIATCRPRWIKLIMAVDSRVDTCLAILRPQTLRDHRALVSALGWPPSLLTSDIEKNKSLGIPNPLVLMHGEKKHIYSQSFVTLCALQHLQAEREARHSLKYEKERKLYLEHIYLDRKTCFINGLWAVDELVHPIAARMEYHFSKWFDQPKFIFALVYKIAKDFMDGIDDILQPLIDQARLAGLSAKEAWVTAMVKVLLGYLERQVFPVLVSTYHTSDKNVEVLSSWLHLLDLMITFDKRIQVLAASGSQLLGPLLESENFSRSLPILSIFNEHSDWLQIWANIELKIAHDKLKCEMEDEKNWLCSARQQSEFGYEEEVDAFLFSTREDYKAPPIAESVVKIAFAMIERSRALPSNGMKIQFVRSSTTIFLSHFFVILLQRCQDLELMIASAEDDAFLKVSCSVNAARYCESVIREWDEDVTFLEMTVDVNDVCYGKENYEHDHQHSLSFFSNEIMYLIKLGTDCLENIMSAILLEFDALCWDYMQNVGQWEELTESKDQVMDEENLVVSSDFVEALDMLRLQIRKLKLHLNSKDFLDLWRSIAEGLDYFIFSSIPWTDVKFSNSGVNQFKADMSALFHIFRPLCFRPEAFFPFVSECLKLLSMNRKDVDYLLKMLIKDERIKSESLQLQGVYHVTYNHAEKIWRNRNFGG
ncbi:RINT1-like protein MAG2L isoform X2 [Typha latifolia]